MSVSAGAVGSRAITVAVATSTATTGASSTTTAVAVARYQRHQTRLYLLNVEIFFVSIVIFDMKQAASR